MTTALSATQCHDCGVWYAARHRCPRLAPRELPDRAPTPAHVPLEPADAAPVVRPHVGASAAADCAELGRWLPTLLGRAATLAPQVRGVVRTTRPDHVDAAHEGLDRARCVLDRLAALAATNPLAALALYACAARGALDDEDAGLLFAEARTRRAWLASDKGGVRRVVPATQGAELMNAAREAYERSGLAALAHPPHDFLRILERRAEAATCALETDREAASGIRSRAAGLRTIAAAKLKAGEREAADAMRAYAGELVAAFVDGREVKP